MKNKVTRGTGNPKKTPDDPEQSKRFEETARLLEADETGKTFLKAIKGVVAPKPVGGRSRPSSLAASE